MDKEIFSIIETEDAAEAHQENFSISRPGLYPSEASVEYMDAGRKLVTGKCLRAAWYRASGVQKHTGVNVGLMMKAHLGKWDEIGTLDRWKSMGILIANNVKFYNKDLVLSGELDAIVKDPATGRKIGYEIKTFYGYPANRSICGVKREKETGNFYAGRPKDEHFLQACLYWWEYRNRLDEYRIYYLERGDGHRLEFRVLFQDNSDGTHQCCWEQIPGKYWNAFKEGPVVQPYTLEDIHARYQTLIKYIKQKQLPPRDYQEFWSDPDLIKYLRSQGDIKKEDLEKWEKNPAKYPIKSWQCSYCDEWRDRCRQDDLTA